MKIVLTDKQKKLCFDVISALRETCGNKKLMLVGESGVGMSTCINKIREERGGNSLAFNSAFMSEPIELMEWLGSEFGMSGLKMTARQAIPKSLIELLSLVGVDLIIFEDFQDILFLPKIEHLIFQLSALQTQLPQLTYLFSRTPIVMTGHERVERFLGDAVCFSLERMAYCEYKKFLSDSYFPINNSKLLSSDRFSELLYISSGGLISRTLVIDSSMRWMDLGSISEEICFNWVRDFFGGDGAKHDEYK